MTWTCDMVPALVPIVKGLTIDPKTLRLLNNDLKLLTYCYTDLNNNYMVYKGLWLKLGSYIEIPLSGYPQNSINLNLLLWCKSIPRIHQIHFCCSDSKFTPRVCRGDRSDTTLSQLKLGFQTDLYNCTLQFSFLNQTGLSISCTSRLPAPKMPSLLHDFPTKPLPMRCSYAVPIINRGFKIWKEILTMQASVIKFSDTFQKSLIWLKAYLQLIRIFQVFTY